ncbi:quinone oxidoreductase family protein [Ruixingdingia sedimenti]|uniref:Quinone oxidoreductase n=1 Tax=Ruixingdingia sedimenti TaxID=3073604 RepID=A0ABU1F4I0_9RHOB|nr:quinone oxidoreductase [Xinfangfangia sp. LG-4]MDR5651538.1 quinone oxidoreductase [Xinfangfangia sp. LG-4]
MKAMAIHANGGPEVLQWVDIDLPAPGPGEVRVRHTAIGLNFSDINVRNGGFYITEGTKFPIILGNEAAGVVEAVGAGVTGFTPGDRVAYVGTGGLFFENTGGYAEERNLRAEHLIHLPDDIDDRQAAAILLKGLTASVVIHRCFTPGPGDTVLIHAAASGVGSLLAQWANHLGAQVIGTVGSREKADFARAHGCHHTILYREEDFVAATRRLVPEGVSAVYDGVGQDTFLKSFDVARPFAALVNYGNASGPVPPFNLMLLAQKGSLALYRPGFGFHGNTPESRAKYCGELFDLLRGGHIKLEISATFPLKDAAAAHRAVEARQTTGSVLLIP